MTNDMGSTCPDKLTSQPDWLAYHPPTAGFDEAFSSTGENRTHWRDFLRSLGGMGLESLKHRWAEARHLIRQNGVTYNVYGDPRGLDRPWQLDPVPLLISPTEADVLAVGLTQRGLLLEAILRDLYGPQRTIALGLLPPELVLNNPAFLRPLRGIVPPMGRYLHLYAANVGRDASGFFWVMGDRSQCPSGAGYTLENRIVLSRMVPDLFRECRVQRLALFFRTLHDTLSALAPPRREAPRIVLLTPGPYNETYFEHAYLARYLGYTLVQGGDLTVRDNRIFLKVLGGLRPVDVIFRRLDDDYCDPLELRHDSFLGVPGLVQAVRAGTVAVANALGSGLLETPALLAFLPGLCRYLLGEELRLPSAPTWWCGQEREREHVLANLKEMVIKPARPSLRIEPVFGGELTREQLARLAERIRAHPRHYIGQQRIQLATSPVLVGDNFEPRHVVMRMYLAAQGDSFAVMPGGLTRVAAAAGSLVVSMQSGGGSKDTWVLSPGPVSTFSLLRPHDQPLDVTRGTGDLPSRMADNLFWLGRYASRAEALTRLLRVVLARLAEKPGLGEAPELNGLLRAVTHLSECYPGFIGTGAEKRLAHPDGELGAVLRDTNRAGSLASVLQRMSGVVSTVRDRISTDMWRVLSELNKFYPPQVPFTDAREGPEKSGDYVLMLSDELTLLDRTVLVLAAFAGLTAESVTRDDGWRFLDLGRKLEQSLQTLYLMQATLVAVSPHEGYLLEALLEVTDSSITYRRRYQNQVQPAAVLDLLLTDETNPRALVFQVAALAGEVERLPRNSPHPGYTNEQRQVLSALTALRLADVQELVRHEEGRRNQLADLLRRQTSSLTALSESLTQTYLSHLQTSRHLGQQSPGATDG
ncbi:MAG: circularly permuted type 2 ATP-grasp protein [Gemmataceae bacterium]